MHEEELARNEMIGAWARGIITEVLPEEIREQLGDSWNVDFPGRAERGDLASNVAFVAARVSPVQPRALAELLAQRLEGHPLVEKAWCGGAGFLNVSLKPATWLYYLKRAVLDDEQYGTLNIGRGQRVHLEFVSANPTGPLHVGHLRGAVLGDVLARLLEKVGYETWREYYVNDSGAQVEALARSAYARYLEAIGKKGEAPSDLAYPGEYLVHVGQALAQQYGDGLRGRQDRLLVVKSFVLDSMLARIKEDLSALGITFDTFFHESSLIRDNLVASTEELLRRNGLVYQGVLDAPKGKVPEDWEPREQTLFRATLFGDDVDRPLRKSDGSWTYFASDAAYHFDKFRRGFTKLINVFGADHAGYIKRLEAVCRAVSNGAIDLDVKVCQLVRLKNEGSAVRMSKRADNFITLREVTDEVGPDAVRFLMLTKKNDAPIDFDFAKAKEQSKDNWVFYVQYAHARISSVFRCAAQEGIEPSPDALCRADFFLLHDEKELEIARKVSLYGAQLAGAAQSHEPHRIVFYLHDLASSFHELWSRGKEVRGLRFINTQKPDLTLARLFLLQAVRATLRSGLSILGIRPLEEMN